jgi:hypothetical protein
VDIKLLDESTLLLKFPFSKVTNEKIKTLGAAFIDKQWTVGISALRKLRSAFPSAKIDEDVHDAYASHWIRVIRGYMNCGVRFCIHDRLVMLRSDSSYISDAFAAAVSMWPQEAADAVLALQVPAKGATTPVYKEVYTPTDSDKLIWKSIQGGIKADEKKKKIVENAKANAKANRMRAKQIAMPGLEEA